VPKAADRTRLGAFLRSSAFVPVLQRRVAILAATSAVGLVLVLTAQAASAGSTSASDSRATLVSGANATTCSDVGFGSDTLVGSSSDSDASDANVSGTVSTNEGTTQPGVGEELDVTLLNSSSRIDAVVVKAGDGYNLYTNPSYLPPTLGPPQHYIGPLVGNGNGGNVPTISHWFVCYDPNGATGASAFPVLGVWAPAGLIAVFVAGAGSVFFYRRRRAANQS
jgi:hypothetical protein